MSFPFGEVSAPPTGGRAKPLSVPDTQHYDSVIHSIISSQGSWTLEAQLKGYSSFFTNLYPAVVGENLISQPLMDFGKYAL